MGFQQRIKKYVGCYFKYFKMNLLLYGEYKIDFFSINIASILILIMGFINIEIIFSQVDTIIGWSKYDIFWMLGFFYLVRAIYNTLFINTLDIGYWIRNGMLDIYIIRPLNTFFQLICTGRYNAELPLDEYIMGIGLMILAQKNIHIIDHAFEIAILIYFVVMSMIIYSCIMFLFSSISFWTLKNNALFELVNNIERLIEYPVDIYNNFIKFILTFILPLAFISYIPSAVLFGGISLGIGMFLSLVVAIILLFFSRFLWTKGIENYQSSGA